MVLEFSFMARLALQVEDNFVSGNFIFGKANVALNEIRERVKS